ncbi:serine/threonine-protein kinase [Methanosphaerula palustris]|uniref:Serine/threonine protein kinase n=1 Tax=Methanosphaerula palustris (strain ATCC BAA-1556 / DSM 19958 / E1-9c) TaxID=521011 RepID=B8GKN1_METPE|nr:serine/threonine-protein kinase [Methanosphaerula palustris]ACL17177.1 serine/threonine protein kinase [Methanosphaerula palustris E1-9c]
MKPAQFLLVLLLLGVLLVCALPAEAAPIALPSPPQFHLTHNNTTPGITEIPPPVDRVMDRTISGVALFLLYVGISLLLLIILMIRAGRRMDPHLTIPINEEQPMFDLAYLVLAMVSAVGVLWLLTVNSELLIRIDLYGIIGLICCFPSVFFSLFSIRIAIGTKRLQVQQSMLLIHLLVAIIAAILLSLLLLLIPASWELPSLALTYISLIAGAVLSAGQFLHHRERHMFATIAPMQALQSGADDQKTLIPSANEEGLLTEKGIPEAITSQYTDLKPAATGGVASVFSATRRSDGMKVALKLPLRHDLATGAGFLKEIRIWEHLNHPNIVRLTHVYLLPTLCLEMEYVPYRLTEQIGSITPARAILIAKGILNGLEYAHLHGYSHCDIKPENILLTEEGMEGIPKITDWGLSEHAGEKTGIACTAFTPWYAAPEQIAPELYGLPGPATDLYQVGVLLYLMLTSAHPFAGKDTDSTCRMILNDSPLPLSAHQPDLAPLDEVLFKCLARNPKDRYSSAAELSADLVRIHQQNEGRAQ